MLLLGLVFHPLRAFTSYSTAQAPLTLARGPQSITLCSSPRGQLDLDFQLHLHSRKDAVGSEESVLGSMQQMSQFPHSLTPMEELKILDNLDQT